MIEIFGMQRKKKKRERERKKERKKERKEERRRRKLCFTHRFTIKIPQPFDIPPYSCTLQVMFTWPTVLNRVRYVSLMLEASVPISEQVYLFVPSLLLGFVCARSCCCFHRARSYESRKIACWLRHVRPSVCMYHRCTNWKEFS